MAANQSPELLADYLAAAAKRKLFRDDLAEDFAAGQTHFSLSGNHNSVELRALV